MEEVVRTGVPMVRTSDGCGGRLGRRPVAGRVADDRRVRRQLALRPHRDRGRSRARCSAVSSRASSSPSRSTGSTSTARSRPPGRSFGLAQAPRQLRQRAVQPERHLDHTAIQQLGAFPASHQTVGREIELTGVLPSSSGSSPRRRRPRERNCASPSMSRRRPPPRVARQPHEVPVVPGLYMMHGRTIVVTMSGARAPIAARCGRSPSRRARREARHAAHRPVLGDRLRVVREGAGDPGRRTSTWPIPTSAAASTRCERRSCRRRT